MAKKQLSIWIDEDLVEFARSLAMEHGLVTNVRTIGDEPTGSISKPDILARIDSATREI